MGSRAERTGLGGRGTRGLIRALAPAAALALALTCDAQVPPRGQPPRPLPPGRGSALPPRPPVDAPAGDAARGAVRRPAELRETRLTLTLGRTLGPMKALLGINAGPVPSGEAGNADLTELYRWAGVREVRTQDFYGPLDLSAMYPDLRADPSLPGSYDFAASDRAFAAIVDAGLMPYLRLGDSYNNVRIPTNRQETEHYIQAAVAVVRHYRLRAMGGFRAHGGCVEIGNEPDNRHFWPGRFEDFLPVFAGVYRELKREMPDVKVGGPGFVVAAYKTPRGREKVTAFLDYLKRNGITPDFISFHLYSDDPAEYFDSVRFYRRETQARGMGAAELHNSEWNTEKGSIEMRTGRKAAPYVTACWIALQQAGADGSYLFRGTDTNIDNPGFYGIFHADGRKKPSAYAFQLWSRMARFTERLEVWTGQPLLDADPALDGPLKPVWVLAGRDGSGRAGILVANLGEQRLTYSLAGLASGAQVDVTELDDPQDGLADFHARAQEEIVLKPRSVQLVAFQAP